MKSIKFIWLITAIVFIAYFIFGVFFLNVPFIKPDELWEISRSHYFLKYHHMGDPMLPVELSPFFASVFSAVPGSQYMGILKCAAQAFFIYILPLNDVYSLRITSFLWSVIVCWLTFQLAKKLGLNKKAALLSSVLLIMVPEFFSQLHRERAEILITAFYLGGLLLFIYTLELEDGIKRKALFFISGIYAWIIVITVHASAIVIPGTFGCIYLFREYKKIISLNSVLLGAGLFTGLFYFFYLMNVPALRAVEIGGGNLLDYTGPPIFRKGIKYFITLPYFFYNKLSGYNDFAKPVSLIFFLTSCISFYILFRKKKASSVFRNPRFIISGIIIPLIILLLFSGSSGNYLLIVFPLCAIVLAAALFEFVFKSETKIHTKYFTLAILFLILLSNFAGIQKQIKYTNEYHRITSELRKTITDNRAAILGMGLYYLNFKDQPFYSYSWLNPHVGKPNQSFTEAVTSVHASYLIIDDVFVSKAYLERGKEWTDSMFVFFNNNCKLVKELEADYYIKNRVPAPGTYPVQWRYENQKKSFLKKIKIYKVSH